MVDEGGSHGYEEISACSISRSDLGLVAYLGRQTPIYAATEPDGAQSYAKHCAICHGEQREGILPAFPPLLGIEHQMTDQQIIDLIHSGKGRMPAFPKLQSEEVTALTRYLASGDIATSATRSTAGSGSTLTIPSKGTMLAGPCSNSTAPSVMAATPRAESRARPYPIEAGDYR